MTQAEFDEMRSMAFEHSSRALREALLRLQTAWGQEIPGLPPTEAARLRQRLSRAKGLKQAIKAAQGCSQPSSGMQLALLWERCRVRAKIALAIKMDDSVALRSALALAEQLGLSVSLEQDLCDEMVDEEQRRLEPVSRTISERSLASGGEEGQATVGGEAAAKAAAPKPRWWQRLAWWGSSTRASRASKQWAGEEELLHAVQEHVKLGNAPMPHELAVDLGLNARPTGSGSHSNGPPTGGLPSAGEAHPEKRRPTPKKLATPKGGRSAEGTLSLQSPLSRADQTL